MKKLTFFIFALLLFGAGFAQTVHKVAMLEARGSGTRIQKTMIRSALTTALINNGYDAFSRTDLDQVTKEFNFQQGGMVSDAQRKKLGQMSGADLICVIETEIEGDNLLIVSSLIELESGRITKNEDELVEDISNAGMIKEACEKLGNKLVGVSHGSRISSSASGNRRVSNAATPAMIQVDGGSFTMGCTSEQSDCGADESPTHQVMVNSFKMSATEITNAQYAAFLNAKNIGFAATYNGNTLLDNQSSYLGLQYLNNQWQPKSGMENHPVVCVTWYGANEYCQWAGGRLPTEAEWEYAARGGKNSRGYKYAGSNMIEDVAWYTGNSGSRTHEVGQKRANELGLYDMSGNVYEWCYDWYANPYNGSYQNNPVGPSSGSDRVYRGGGWNSIAQFCRVAYRGSNTPSSSNDGMGFRLVIP